MFRRILVPLDGSARAERALPVAIRIAKASGKDGAVILMRVVNPMNDYWSAGAMMQEPTMPQSLIDTEISEASQYLSNITKSYDCAGLILETVVLFGPVASTILTTATEHKADMIVLCSHGYTGMKRWVMGSVAEKIARHSLLPVFILREGAALPAAYASEHATQAIRTLVPLDGSPYAKAALVPAAYLTAAFAGKQTGELQLLRVVAPVDARADIRDEPKIVHKASTYLQKTIEHIEAGLVAAPMSNLKLTLGWSVVEDTDAAAAIVHVAEQGAATDTASKQPYDMVVMATHGRGGLQRWAMGSVTERVLNTSQLPVLVVRPQELAPTSEPVWEKTATVV